MKFASFCFFLGGLFAQTAPTNLPGVVAGYVTKELKIDQKSYLETCTTSQAHSRCQIVRVCWEKWETGRWYAFPKRRFPIGNPDLTPLPSKNPVSLAAMLTWFEIDCEEKGLMSPLSVEPMLKRLFVLTPVHKEVISERLRLYNGPFQQEPPRKKPPRKGRGTTLK